MQKLFVGSLLSLLLLIGLASDGLGQTANCPPNLVCISREAAQKALQDSDTVKTQAEQLKANETAYNLLKQALNDLRIELSRMSGENTALKQNAVSDRAIIEILLKSSKKKCFPFSLCL